MKKSYTRLISIGIWLTDLPIICWKLSTIHWFRRKIHRSIILLYKEWLLSENKNVNYCFSKTSIGFIFFFIDLKIKKNQDNKMLKIRTVPSFEQPANWNDDDDDDGRKHNWFTVKWKPSLE